MVLRCHAASSAAASYRSIKFAFVAASLLAFKAYSSDFMPQGWTTHSSNGVAYYYNRNTGITQWEKPVAGTNSHHYTEAIASSKSTESLNPILQHASQNDQRSTIEILKSAQNTTLSSIEASAIPQIIDPNRHSTKECIDDTHINEFTAPNELHLNQTGNKSAGETSNSANLKETSISPEIGCITPHGPPHENVTVGVSDLASGDVGKGHTTDLKNGIAPTVETSNHLDSLPYVTKLREADLIIDQLNEKIDCLEEEKAKLLLQISDIDEARANYTLSVEAAVLSTAEEHSSSITEQESRISALEKSLKDLNEELEALRADKTNLEEELSLIASTTNVTSSFHVELKANYSLQVTELKSSRELLTQQEKELADAYKEIGQLEEDMRNVAGPSLRRLRQPSIFSRILGRMFPVWVGGKGSLKSGRRAKGRAAALSAALETAQAMNRTVESLRENLTAMASLLDSKETAIEELSEQLAEGIEEADKRYRTPCLFSILRYPWIRNRLLTEIFTCCRREAYIDLKDGVDNLQEENIRLLEDLESR